MGEIEHVGGPCNGGIVPIACSKGGDGDEPPRDVDNDGGLNNAPLGLPIVEFITVGWKAGHFSHHAGGGSEPPGDTNDDPGGPGTVPDRNINDGGSTDNIVIH